LRGRRPQSLADAELPSLLAIYKDIHAHPELSGHEERSAAIVAKELKAAGCDVTEKQTCEIESLRGSVKLQRASRPRVVFLPTECRL
jgi:metal-dependent amidase/aminoacylase/carboxypeptidase family protein